MTESVCGVYPVEGCETMNCLWIFMIVTEKLLPYTKNESKNIFLVR